MGTWTGLGYIVAVGGVITLLAIALIVVWKIFTDKIDLKDLISEPSGPGEPAKASLARFQFLIFTFVVASVFLFLCIESGTFVEIPQSVLGLIGISGGSFVIAKGISSATEQTKVKAQADRDAAGGGANPG